MEAANRVSSEPMGLTKSVFLQDVQQKIYQIREGADGQLRIGFEKIAQSLFEDDDF
jgi:hypothetical protein